MASSNRREGSSGIDFGADFSGLHERPALKGVDLERATPLEIVARAEEPRPESAPPGEQPELPQTVGVSDADTDPLTKLLNTAERERGLPYTFRIPISMDREFRTLAKEFDLDLSDIARSGLEMAMLRLRQMASTKKRSASQ
jgi:hypothetical protein